MYYVYNIIVTTTYKIKICTPERPDFRRTVVGANSCRRIGTTLTVKSAIETSTDVSKN